MSRRTVFRRIAQRQYGEWPAYDSTPLYGRTSLAGLESDIRTVSETWFDHDSHDSIEEFVCVLPLAYFRFRAHDRYVGPTRYQMATLFRVFVLQECHGWEHETALVGYLGNRPELCDQLGFETIPDQSTLWRSWHERFTADLRETVETAARTILIKAQHSGVAVPRNPERKPQYHNDESGETSPDDQSILEEAEKITDHVSRIVFPVCVNARVGPQLSTVIDVSSDEVQTDFDNTAFELSVEGASEEARAEVIAERADELRDRAESIHDDFDEATEAYEEGDLTKSEYAQRLAVLNARATNLLDSYEQLRQRAANVSTLELRAAGVTQSALDRSVENLSSVTGTGANALLKQFTGESDGEIELETENGLSIEVESEDGERSREFERPRDDTDTVTVSQSAALETARGALSSVGGDWVLSSSEVDADGGAYEFAFVLRNASNLTGEAEVAVDGSSGDIFSLEEEIGPRDDDGEAADEEDDSDRELTMVVVEGTPGPNERITVQVLANGEPAGNVPVYLNDRPVGTTDSEGRVMVTLPTADEAELTAETDDAEAKLEFEFEDAEEDDQETESEPASESEGNNEEAETPNNEHEEETESEG